MAEYPAFFPGYNHEILKEAHLRQFKPLVRSVIPDFSAMVIGEVSPLQLRHEMRAHIFSLNHPDIWQRVLKASTTKNRISTVKISEFNDGPVDVIAHLATAGIFVGHTQLAGRKVIDREIPIMRAILESLDQFPDPISGFDELITRSAQVLGTVEQQGTFGLALESLDEPVFVGQGPFLDLLRIYGSDQFERYAL